MLHISIYLFVWQQACYGTSAKFTVAYTGVHNVVVVYQLLFLLKAQRWVESRASVYLQIYSPQCFVLLYEEHRSLKEFHLSPDEGPTSKSTPWEGCPTVNTLRNLCRDWLLAGSFGGKEGSVHFFYVLSGINSMLILRAGRAFERNLKAKKKKKKHFAIFCCCMSNTHVSWMWTWSLGFVWTAMSALCDKAPIKSSYVQETIQSICNLYACVFKTFFFFWPQSLIVWHPLKYVQLFTPPPPSSLFHRGLKTSINVDTVDNGFSFYEMKYERIM